MRMLRPLLYLMVLATALIVGGCDTAPTTESIEVSSQILNTPVAVTPAPSSTPTPAPLRPMRLLIPAINVNAHVELVGILPNGDLATPTHSPWEDVGWYDDGPLPGQKGSAVIDGHLDRPGGYPAVFWNLRDLQVGNDIFVINSDSTRLHFRVTQVALYPPKAAPLQEIFGNNGGKYLNLITCAGDWIPSEHQTTLRLVVYTSLVS